MMCPNCYRDPCQCGKDAFTLGSSSQYMPPNIGNATEDKPFRYGSLIIEHTPECTKISVGEETIGYDCPHCKEKDVLIEKLYMLADLLSEYYEGETRECDPEGLLEKWRSK